MSTFWMIVLGIVVVIILAILIATAVKMSHGKGFDDSLGEVFESIADAIPDVDGGTCSSCGDGGCGD